MYVCYLLLIYLRKWLLWLEQAEQLWLCYRILQTFVSFTMSTAFLLQYLVFYCRDFQMLCLYPSVSRWQWSMKPLILLEQGLNETSRVCYVLCVSNETCVCVCRRVLPEWKPQRWLQVGNWFCSQLLMGTSQSNKASLQRGAHTGKQGRKIIWECLV